MPHFVYIIYSSSKDRYYVGETAFLEGRIKEHNSGQYIHSSTKYATDWTLFLSIECSTRHQALKLERFIKRMKSRSFYYKIKDNPQLQSELLERFR